ncbi:hypothetical protein LL967_07900 [Xanthomonas campestris pv. zinniae]|nr:hypothetical protein [Xanthomonas campestris pv. zinniae]
MLLQVDLGDEPCASQHPAQGFVTAQVARDGRRLSAGHQRRRRQQLHAGLPGKLIERLAERSRRNRYGNGHFTLARIGCGCGSGHAKDKHGSGHAG